MNGEVISHRTVVKYGRITLCLILFLFAIDCRAQESPLKTEYSYRRYTTQDGLPSVVNERIYQDKRGFIWIAGTSGLARFDGFEFKTFLKGTFANLYHIEAIKSQNANQQGESIRVFSNRFMYVIDPVADTLRPTFRFDDCFPTVFSSRVLPSGYGIFYAAGKDDEQYFCAVRDTGIVRLIAHDDLNRLQDHDKAWYDETKNHLYLPLTEGISIVNEKGRIAFHEGIHAKCFVAYQNALWAVATDGLYRQTNDGRFEKVIHNVIDYSDFVKSYANADGSLLFSDYSSIYRYDGHRIEKIFEANAVKDFIVDKEGNIWVATYQGIYNLFNLKFRNYSFYDKSDNMRSVVFDTMGKRIIAGSLNGRLFEIQGNAQRELSYPPNPFTSDVSFQPHGLETGGAVYLPGPGGFLQIKGKTSRWITFPDALFMFQFVTSLPDGNLLTGGTSRLIKTTPEGNVLQNISMSDLQQRVYSKPCLDRNGRIWIGGASGLNIIDGNNHITTIFDDSLSYCRVMNTDTEGILWFVSENRLFRAENENNIRKITSFDSQITNVCFTKSGTLVVSTLDKIYLFDRNMESFVFDSRNGFTGIESVRGDIIEDNNGYLWVPMVECLTTFHPDLLKKEMDKLNLHLLSCLVSNNNIQWKTFDVDKPQLGNRYRNIRFSYIAPSYTAVQNVRYHYRLHGFQNDWSEPAKNREITFNNLPPGDYRFEIFADAGTDESRSETQSFAFSITPAFWQTAWFPVACVAFLMLSSAGVALYVQRRKNKALLENLRVEKELNELRISSIRLKAIPHFNANVLSAIEYFIANRTKEEAMRILGVYSDFTFKTLSEVDKAARPLSDELAYVKMYLELEKIRFLNKFDFRIEVETGVNEEVQLPNMILHTYCENAVKHGLMPLKSGGMLTINVTQHNRMVCLSVHDNGVGRAYAAQNPHLHSTKQGLSILNRQIEIYNRFNREKINQQVKDLFLDGEPKGTVFTVEIPLDFEYIN